MPRSCVRSSLVSAILFIVSTVTSPAHAAPSTSRGQISVAQVIQMLDNAQDDRTAQQVLTAYLAGVGEAAGVVVDMGGASCGKRLSLTAGDVRQAVTKMSGQQDLTEASATPLIVRDMLDRAKCKPVR